MIIRSITATNATCIMTVLTKASHATEIEKLKLTIFKY